MNALFNNANLIFFYFGPLSINKFSVPIKSLVLIAAQQAISCPDFLQIRLQLFWPVDSVLHFITYKSISPSVSPAYSNIFLLCMVFWVFLRRLYAQDDHIDFKQLVVTVPLIFRHKGQLYRK